MKTKTITLKIHVTEAEKVAIDAAQRAAGYQTRSAYILDSALLQTPLNLTEIARQLGQLGLLCNELLGGEDDEVSHLRLVGNDARKAASRITMACDAVIAALQTG